MKGGDGLYQTLITAASWAEQENAEFLFDLTRNLPWRWDDQDEEGDLTVRFPGLPSE